MSKPRYRMLGVILIAALLHPLAAIRAQTPDGPVYVRIDSGWLGLFGRGNEYARFSLIGRDVQLQDATHILVRKSLGLMISFVENKDLAGPDPLTAHVRWEADYWRQHSARLDTATRSDLADRRADLRVSELTSWNRAGEKLGMYLIGLRASEGVFVFAFSPASAATNAEVIRFVRSLQLVDRSLTAAEVARISRAVRATKSH